MKIESPPIGSKRDSKIFSMFSDALQGKESKEVTEDESSLREQSEAPEHDGRGDNDGWNIRGPKKSA